MTPKPAFAVLPLALAVSIHASTVHAAPGSDARANANLEEVVVTAQRREQTLQEVPISVQVLSEDALEQNNISSLSDIATITPGLSFGASAEGETISMRGIATRTLSIGLQNSTAIYLDGVYLGGGTSQLGELQDVARIEVLRGPQGTLFGRNAVAGAISVTTNSPTETFEGSVTGGIGSDNLGYINTTINAPVSDTLLTRTSISRTNSDGAFENTSGGKRFGAVDNVASRTKVTWLASDDVTVDVALDAGQYGGSRSPLVLDRVGYTPGFNIAPGVPGINGKPLGTSKLSDKKFPNSFVIFDEAGNAVKLDPGFGDSKNEGLSFKVNWDLNDSMTLTSATSYRASRSLGYTGTAGLVTFDDGVGGSTAAVSGYVARTNDRRKEYSQEFRLSGTSDAIDWFMGVNYAKTKNTRRDKMALPAAAAYTIALGGPFEARGNFGDAAQNVDVDIESVALFGDALIPLTSDVNVSVGARYSRDSTAVKWHAVQNRQQVFYANVADGGIKVDDSWNNLSGRVVFDWTINDAINTYAGVTQGYKAGGYGTTLAPTFNADFTPDPVHPGASIIKPFDEEKSINYEVGIKSALLDDALYLNAALYHTDYTDYQMQGSDPNNQKISIADTADAYSRGLEMDMTWLATEQLTVGLNVGLNESEFKEANQTVAKGQRLLRAPKFTASLNLDYLQTIEPGSIRYNMTYSYSSTQRLTNSKVSDIPGKDTYTFKKDDIYSGSFDNLNARVTFTPNSQRWQAALWATNLLDKAYRADEHIILSNSTYSDLGGATRAYVRNQPRAIGAELTYYFGDL